LCFVRDAPVWLAKKSAQASSFSNDNSTLKNFKRFSAV
jgi:hypothetical protein